jgi:hypothetical protein
MQGHDVVVTDDACLGLQVHAAPDLVVGGREDDRPLLVVDTDADHPRRSGDGADDVMDVLLAVEQHRVVGRVLDDLARACGPVVDRLHPLLGSGPRADEGVGRKSDNDDRE